MTTTLMPPEVDEQLDAEAVEELTPRCWYYDLWIVPCRAPAVWLVDVRCRHVRGWLRAAVRSPLQAAR